MTGNTVAIIQARMRSTRLPGKVMRSLAGTTVLGHVIRRVRSCALVDAIVVATSTSAADDVIAAESAAHGAAVYRGSEDDVLARCHGAAIEAHAACVVRVTSDCPLIDPQVLCRMVAIFRERNEPAATLDYLSNTLGQRTFPRGLDVEVFTLEALSRAHSLAEDPWDREHVTPYIYAHPGLFRLETLRQATDQSPHRWTLDTEEDWALIQAIYAGLGAGGALFSTQDVIDFLRERPELCALNANVAQKQRASMQRK